ncbi:hypothetical protein [Microbacterium trichothecenolyticum]|nr:hypothetical protein [Microbacterium trichothecenolyticum]
MNLRGYIPSLPAAVKVTFLDASRGEQERELIDYDDRFLVFQNRDETEIVPWASIGALSLRPVPEPEVWPAS